MTCLVLDRKGATVSAGAEAFKNHALTDRDLFNVKILAPHLTILINRIGNGRLDKLQDREGRPLRQKAQMSNRLFHFLTAHQVNQQTNFAGSLMIILK